ncbi:hypothetical protein FGG08_004455 [Glutinoglossum americanum]|uniref:Uncharacterized protein n=1 Tax=Glutinoglossum americanum TaxID=1670608 RepID=A0A9P8IBF4_9PEZI|nr:hypothetical protein FGG08_004455 [Glutinoglossum americanum]
MAHPHSESLHLSGSTTNSASAAFSTPVSGIYESMRNTCDDDFNSHVKRLVEAFQALAGEIEFLRRRYPSVSYREPDCLTKGKASVDHICRCMGWHLEDRRSRENTHTSPPAEAEQLEMDFTTKGKEGDLACPFAFASGFKHTGHHQNASATPPNAKARHPRRISDPITAELHGASPASPPPSISASASKCPIRYLDQHSPEEVAQYFESHKHELPRSHEICVKRYQSNKESIRQLDAKYGDLVSMIQGLGVTHKPLLPAKDDDEDDGVEAGRGEVNGRLEQWAEGVDGTNGEADDRLATEEGGQEEGTGRGRGRERDVISDRILKEVRVGESPSRPWGIPFPPQEAPTLSGGLLERTEATEAITTTTTDQPTNIPGREANTKRKACPIRSQQQQQPQQDSLHPHHQPPLNNTRDPGAAIPAIPAIQFKHNAAFISDQPTPSTTTATATGGKVAAQQQVPQMVFTGPVFIGYPIEQAMALLGRWNGVTGVGSMQGQ